MRTKNCLFYCCRCSRSNVMHTSPNAIRTPHNYGRRINSQQAFIIKSCPQRVRGNRAMVSSQEKRSCPSSVTGFGTEHSRVLREEDLVTFAKPCRLVVGPGKRPLWFTTTLHARRRIHRPELLDRRHRPQLHCLTRAHRQRNKTQEDQGL